MVLYLAVALFPFLVKSFKIDEHRSRNTKLLKIIISALPMFLLIALRGPLIGADTWGYLREFSDMIDIPWANIFDNTREEHGFRIFVKLTTYITKSSSVYQIIYTFIYFIGIVSFANNLDFDATWFLFFFATLGGYTFMFTGVRQCMAMSICLFSYKYIKKRRLIPFLLCVALAFNFHKSSILFLFGYLIYGRKFDVINILLYVAITLITLLYLDQLNNFFNERFEYNYEIEETGNGWVFFVFLLLLTAVATILIVRIKRLNKESTGLFNVGVIAILFWFLRIFTRTAERPSFYFMFFSCAFIGYVMEELRTKREGNVVQIIVGMVCFGYYIYRFLTSFSTLVPYQFFF